jgi:hypothetical protein
LYRFTWAFDQVQKGDLSFRVKIRRRDYLHQEEAVLNEMIEMLAGKLGGIQLASLGASKSWGEIEQKLSDWTESDKKLLGVHGQQIDPLVDTARYFRLREDEKDR